MGVCADDNVVDIVFAGGQSNAIKPWANGIAAGLKESGKFKNLKMVHVCHPGHWMKVWYTDKPGKNFENDFYNDKGSGALEKAWKEVLASGKTPRLAGFFWFQGEGDSKDPEEKKVYAGRFNTILSLLQKRFEIKAPVNFAVAIIDGSNNDKDYFPANPEGRTREQVEEMRTILKKLGEQPNGVAVDTRDASRRDMWHLMPKAAEKLGKEMAKDFVKAFAK
jgi:hypothetical protein